MSNEEKPVPQETPPPPPPPSAPSTSPLPDMKKEKTDIDQVIIRPWPKIIQLYPTALICLLFGIIQMFYDLSTDKGIAVAQNLGLIFFIIFGLNLLVFSFEFSRLKSLTIGVSILAVLFMCLWLGDKWPIIKYFRVFVGELEIHVSTHMYFGLMTYFLVIFIGVVINTRFNYYIIKHNEIYHRTGFLGKVKRYPSPNLKLSKEINDIFEFILLRSGRLIIYPATETEAIVLDNVLNINRVDRDINELLGKLAVEIDM